jgi:hypothetical protein
MIRMRKISALLILSFLMPGLFLMSSGRVTAHPAALLGESVEPGQAALDSGRLARYVASMLVELRLLPEPVSVAPTTVPIGTGQTIPPEKWHDWPIVPVVSDRAKQIYQQGLAMGNIPTHFSKVGDCQNIRQYFLGIFDSPGTYGLGRDNEYLIPTIVYFAGSWGRLSEAVRSGFNVASVLTATNANPKTCQPGETPLECEFRAWKPAYVLISMETWTKDRPTSAYEGYLRKIIDFAISRGTVPILATKADNIEGDYSINLIIAKLAAEYDLPLWNFFKATFPLDNNGLEHDKFHLTNAPNFFNDENRMKAAWPWRNLTALQALDKVRRAVTK